MPGEYFVDEWYLIVLYSRTSMKNHVHIPFVEWDDHTMAVDVKKQDRWEIISSAVDHDNGCQRSETNETISPVQNEERQVLVHHDDFSRPN